ncbi:hypothetical protein B7463_g4226, partial [Scytalidium lignicola]
MSQFAIPHRLKRIKAKLPITLHDSPEEVLKGVTYISSLELSCKHLSMANIRFSLAGEIKLVLDFQTLYHDHLYEGSKTSQVLLDFPILAELIEEMILTRYHLTPDDEKWSEDALSFLSCTLSGSLESLVNYHFLRLAVSPRRLIPRIRFAFATSRGVDDAIDGDDSLSHDDECVGDTVTSYGASGRQAYIDLV